MNTSQFYIALNGYENEFHLAISLQHPAALQLRDELDEGLKRLRQSGELNTILAQYGLRDWLKK